MCKIRDFKNERIQENKKNVTENPTDLILIMLLNYKVIYNYESLLSFM